MHPRWKLCASLAATVLAGAPCAYADQTANAAVQATGLGVDGSNIKIGILEAAVGLPQLSPANPNMPLAGAAGGQNGRITVVANPFLASGQTPALSNHATFVNGTIMGLNGIGIAPNAQVFSMPVNDVPDYTQGAEILLRSDQGGPNVPVMNFSFSDNGTPTNGSSVDTLFQDWAAQTQPGAPISNKLFVVAGNEIPAGTRTAPWDNFNGITVAPTAGANYQILANYAQSDVTSDGRFKTDLVAPGGGTGNDGISDTLQNPVIVNGGLDSNSSGLNANAQFAGTSFSAPLTTGAAALLLQDAANQNVMLDHRVLKALILNGASTNVGYQQANDWHPFGANGAKPNPSGVGTSPVFIGWDQHLGTGLLDVRQSKANLDAGQQSPIGVANPTGIVNPIGWDENALANTGDHHDYLFSSPLAGLSNITATLAWDRRVALVEPAGDSSPVYDAANGAGFTASVTNDLDLRLYDVTQADALVYFSSSALDTIEHINYAIPSGSRGDLYDLQVDFFNNADGSASTGYGLAWNATAVPEPGSLAMLAAVGLLSLRRRHAVHRV